MDGVNKRHSICFLTDVFIFGGIEKVFEYPQTTG